MKLSDTTPKVFDEVITEVRAIKRAISERHGNDIDRLLASLISQERAAGIGQGGQAGNEQSAIRPQSTSDGSDNPRTESEERSQ
jgi:hypothetical protein